MVVKMAYTRHGWHIYGTVLEDRPIGLLTENCGGPEGKCADCFEDANNPPEAYSPVPPQFKTIDAKALHHGRETLIKAYDAFRRAGISEHQAATVLDEMMSAGLIFMERKR